MSMKRLYWKIVITEGLFLALVISVAVWVMGLSHDAYESRRDDERTAVVELLRMALANGLAPDISLDSLEEHASRLLRGDLRIVESDAADSGSVLDVIHFNHGGTSYALVISDPAPHKDGHGIASLLFHEKYGAILLVLTAALGLLAIPLARIVTQPLGELRQDMRQFASGDLDHRTKVASRDEVGEVARDFNEMADAIQGLVRVGKEMTAHVSHELRSPLTRIDVARQVLEERLTGEPLALLDSMREEIQVMDALIDRILRLSRLELNQSNPTPLCFVEIMNDALRRQAASWEAKGIRLRTEFPASLPGIGVSEDIACLADNLLSNALKFTSSGGIVDVSLRQNEGCISMVISNDAQEPAVDPMRLTEPFQRGNASESIPGSGLGLAIARRIVENHNGDISLSWAKNRFTVVVTLPQDDE